MQSARIITTDRNEGTKFPGASRQDSERSVVNDAHFSHGVPQAPYLRLGFVPQYGFIADFPAEWHARVS
jgi:hypothetical protein